MGRGRRTVTCHPCQIERAVGFQFVVYVQSMFRLGIHAFFTHHAHHLEPVGHLFGSELVVCGITLGALPVEGGRYVVVGAKVCYGTRG